MKKSHLHSTLPSTRGVPSWVAYSSFNANLFGEAGAALGSAAAGGERPGSRSPAAAPCVPFRMSLPQAGTQTAHGHRRRVHRPAHEAVPAWRQGLALHLLPKALLQQSPHPCISLWRD